MGPSNYSFIIRKRQFQDNMAEMQQRVTYQW